jgi:hypothetical protein
VAGGTPALILAHTSTVGDIRTEFYRETEDGPAVVYRKTCLICKIPETFRKPRFGDDYDTFARHSTFAGLHYRLHGEHYLEGAMF